MLACPKQLIYSSPNYKIEPDFPCLADEIVEPRPDMNIKVAAFTVSEKSIYKIVIFSYQLYIEGSQVIISEKYCISFSKDRFYLSKQCRPSSK